MAVTITENASKELKRFMESQEDAGSLLRIGITSGGCSGFQYDFRFVDELDEENDTVSEQHGVKVVVDKKSDLLMDGTTVDYYESLEKRGFTFDNPNAVKSCGCGSSFSA